MLQKQTVSTEKMRRTGLYEKKLLVKCWWNCDIIPYSIISPYLAHGLLIHDLRDGSFHFVGSRTGTFLNKHGGTPIREI